MIVPHKDEFYKCFHCLREYKVFEVNQSWRCPICTKPISIKVEIDGFFHNCNRIMPSEINSRFSLVLENKKSYKIINITRNGDNYNFALKGYSVICFQKNDLLLVINGGWYE